VRDELGDWRVCVLSPRGGRVHAPWAMAAAAKIREETGADVETIWGDDGFVVRFPDVDQPPDPRLLLPEPDEVQALVVRQLGATALFAAKFRENAARSLLLPKRRAGQRAPLWQQRKRSADLLAVASRYGSFPVLLETYRECLRDFFDMPALASTLADVRSRAIRVATVDSDVPSPFAASLLFSYVASFLYDGDAPLAERRAQALAVDQSQLRELVGDAEMRELLDAESMEAIERHLQRLDPKYQARSIDGVHDMLLGLGDLTAVEIAARTTTAGVAASIATLEAERRAIKLRIAGEPRYVAVEDAARFRDAIGAPPPPGLPDALLQPVRDPLGDLALRFARTHAPFAAIDFATRYALAPAAAEAVLTRLAVEGRLIEGEFRPGGTQREWADANVLRMLRRRSLAKLRHEIEPVDQAALGRLTTTWQGIVKRRHGADALLDAIEQLQGAPIPASLLETEMLPARIDGYDPADLDALTAAGEIVWVGVEPLGERDGRIALYLADHLAALLPPRIRSMPDAAQPANAAQGRLQTEASAQAGLTDRESAIVDHLRARGASFFGPLHEASGGGYPAETVDALWSLVWRGLVTNDTFHALRTFTRARVSSARKARRPGTQAPPAYRSRRAAPPSAEGRWALVECAPAASTRIAKTRDATKWSAAMAQQLLARHGVLTREAVGAESIPGGFGLVYPALKAMEESGRVRRGYFVAGLGATQFALPGAVDLLRSLRDAPEDPELAVLAATDPANPYGATLKWPGQRSAQNAPNTQRKSSSASTADSALNVVTGAGRGPTRSVGATVMLVDGALAAYIARGDRQLTTFLPEAEPARSKAARAVARALLERARSGGDAPRGLLIEEIDGQPPSRHALAPFLADAGFTAGALGYALVSGRSSVVNSQSPEGSPQSSAARHQSSVHSHQSRPRRSTVSSPFARRYFDDESNTSDATGDTLNGTPQSTDEPHAPIDDEPDDSE
jgi:ATP-dependent helicase Lhr and Lhr-like helicase